MTIRKTGSATGQVTGVEHSDAMVDGFRPGESVGSGLKHLAAQHLQTPQGWSPDDERELADENDRSDRPGA